MGDKRTRRNRNRARKKREKVLDCVPEAIPTGGKVPEENARNKQVKKVNQAMMVGGILQADWLEAKVLLYLYRIH